MGCGTYGQKGLRTTTSLSRMKNWAEQLSDPQITGSKPLICLRVIRPSMPHDGHDSTAQYGSSFSPISPAFSSTKTVPGCICSGIHSLRRSSSATMRSSFYACHGTDVNAIACLRNFFNTPGVIRRSYRSIRLSGDDPGPYLPNRVG